MTAYSAACDKNKAPIAEVLTRYLKPTKTNSISPPVLLEIGSGTGQHAVYFSGVLPHIQWQPTNQAHLLANIENWRCESPQANCLPPLACDLNNAHWPLNEADHIFTANTLHIVSWPLVLRFIAGVQTTLKLNGYLFIYGPFNYAGNYTSDSNAKFDLWLKQRDTNSGIRDFEAVNKQLTANQSISLVEDVTMPANNRLLVFQKNA